MNQQPPGHDESDDVDELYRRASALDSSRPSESVRKAVLAHAARLAEERASSPAGATASRNRARWRPAVFGTLAAAALAGLMIAPRFLSPSAPEPTAAAPEPAAAPLARSGGTFGRLQAAAPPVLSADAATTGSVAASAPALRAAAPQPEAKRAQDNSKTLTGVTVSAARRGPADQTLAEVVSVGASPAEFLHAAEEGDLPSLRRQLDRHVDIDSRDSLGRTALMLATLRGQAEAVDLLLDNGADPNVADNRGTTPVQVARQANATAIVSALERKGPLR
jgi:hypothetical protein